MPELLTDEPWKQISEYALQGEVAPLSTLLDTLPPSAVARSLSLMDPASRSAFFALLPAERGAELLEEVSDVQAAEILRELDPRLAAALLNDIDSDHRADILCEMESAHAAVLLRRMAPEAAADARRLMRFDDRTAGGVMVTEYVCFEQDRTVADVIADLRENAEEYADFGVQYVYVRSREGTLVGVVRMRDLILSPASTTLDRVMIVNPVYVLAEATLDELEDLFDRYEILALPVTDAQARLVGVVFRSDLHAALGEQQEKAFLRYSGIMSGEELRSMPLRIRATRRLAWLGLNLGLSILAASVILVYESTVSNVFALVFFLPVIGNMSGCSGNQAVAVSIREMALGLVEGRDALRVWRNEMSVGLINGVVLGGGMAAIAAFIWNETPWLGAVVGVAFAVNTLVAVSLGGLVPLALRGLKLDPALGAPPVMTTLSDMCGFVLVLGLAGAALALGVL